MDETMVPLYPGSGKGTVMGAARDSNRAVHGSRFPASRKQLRGYISHLATVCDNATLQPHMPQFLIGGARLLLRRDFQEYIPRTSGNIFIVRQQSAWVSHECMVVYIRTLSGCLQQYAKEFQPVLLMDTSNVHTHKAVLEACRHRGIWPCFVPAGLTWLLQPLDTHVFARYKRFLQRRYAEEAARRQNPRLSTVDILDLACQGTRVILQGHRWADAFDRTGFGARQRKLGDRASRVVSEDKIELPPQDMPLHRILEAVMPKGRVLSTRLLRRGHCAQDREPRHEKPPSRSHSPPRPWPQRLRSHSSANLPSNADAQAIPAPALSQASSSTSPWRPPTPLGPQPKSCAPLPKACLLAKAPRSTSKQNNRSEER